MSINDSVVNVRKEVVLALIEKEPTLDASSIIKVADQISEFIFDGCPKESNQQILNKDKEQKLDSDAVMDAFLDAIPRHSTHLMFVLKKFEVLP